MNNKALLAELIGTFGLTLAVLTSIAHPGFPVATPIMAALTLMLFVYSVGSVSGTHINPAVTIGLLVIRKISTATAVGYIAAQLIGAFLAKALAGVILQSMPITGADGGTFMTAVFEACGDFFLVFGVVAVVLKRVPEAMSGIVIGGSLLLGISVAAAGSAGILNPAVACAIGSCSIWYIVGPLVGGVIGSIVSKALSSQNS